MKKIIILLTITLFALSISSCASITEVDEDKVKDVSDKITEAIIDTVGKENAVRNESHTIDAEGLNSIKINSSVGNIDIATHESKDTIINISIAAKTGSKEKSEQLVNEFRYSVEEKVNSIIVDTSFNDIKFDDNNVSTDLSITVPANIENIIIDLNVGDIYINKVNGKYEIKNNVGNIELESSTASYDIKTNVGEIILSDASAVSNSEFSTNTGDIIISLKDITNADSITASTDVGDIKLNVPDEASYEAVINEFMEKERIEANKDEQTKIKLKTGVGNIDFSK